MSEETRDHEEHDDNDTTIESGPDAQEKPAGVDRRNLFKGLASLPVLGALGAAAWGKKAADDSRRQAIIDELGVSGDAPAIIDRLMSRPPSDRINIGIIGFGGEGEAVVRAAGFPRPEWIDARREAQRTDSRDRRLDEYLAHGDLNLELTGVSDLFDNRAQWAIDASNCETRPGGAPAGRGATRYRRYTEMLDDGDVDAVIIATPDHWHAQISIDAANAGKHIYCEKAMTRTEEEVLPVVEAVKQSGVKFQLGHQNRQLESHEKAREVYEKGILGPARTRDAGRNNHQSQRSMGCLGVGYPSRRQSRHHRLGAVPGARWARSAVLARALLPLALLVRLRYRPRRRSAVA